MEDFAEELSRFALRPASPVRFPHYPLTPVRDTHTRNPLEQIESAHPAATASSVPFITAPPVFENRDIRAMGLSLTTTHSSSGQLVEKHIEGSNPTAPGNDEISPGDTIDLVAATNGALAGIVEHAIFGPELVDGRAPTRGIVFTEDVAKIEFTLISNDKRACIDWSRENLAAIKVQ